MTAGQKQNDQMCFICIKTAVSGRGRSARALPIAFSIGKQRTQSLCQARVRCFFRLCLLIKTKRPERCSVQDLFPQVIEKIVRILHGDMVEDRMDDHAVTDVPGMELSYMAQAQDALCLWQGDPHSQTDGQQLIAGRSGLLSVKDLVGVGLVQAGGGALRSP